MSMYLADPRTVRERVDSRGGLPENEGDFYCIREDMDWKGFQAWIDLLCISDLEGVEGRHDRGMAVGRLASTVGSDEYLPFSLAVLGSRHRALGHTNNALALISVAVEGDRLRRYFHADALRRLAYVLTDLAELAEARKAAVSGLGLLDAKTTSAHTMAGFLATCGHVFMMSSQFDQAKNYYAEAWHSLDLRVERWTGFVVAQNCANIVSLDPGSSESDLVTALRRVKCLEGEYAFPDGSDAEAFLKWCKGRLNLRLDDYQVGLEDLRSVREFFRPRNLHSWVSVSIDLVLGLARSRALDEAKAIVRELIPVIRDEEDIRFSKSVREAFQQVKLATMQRANLPKAARIMQAALARQGNAA